MYLFNSLNQIYLYKERMAKSFFVYVYNSKIDFPQKIRSATELYYTRFSHGLFF